MRVTLAILCLAAVTCVGATLCLRAGEKDSPPPRGSVELATLMQAKLASSQKITEGLVTKDFQLIKKGAEEWRRIATATDWYSHKDTLFLRHRAELVNQASKLVRAAEDGNLDAATYTYFGAVRTCIECHEHCRDVLHLPTIRSPRAVTPIPVTDEDPTAAKQ